MKINFLKLKNSHIDACKNGFLQYQRTKILIALIIIINVRFIVLNIELGSRQYIGIVEEKFSAVALSGIDMMSYEQ